MRDFFLRSYSEDLTSAGFDSIASSDLFLLFYHLSSNPNLEVCYLNIFTYMNIYIISF